MAELLERQAQRRSEEVLGREWLRAMDALNREIGGVVPPRALTRAVTICPRLVEALVRNGPPKGDDLRRVDTSVWRCVLG